MKILILHSYYQLRGGEDAVFEAEADLLAKTHAVMRLVFENKAGLAGALQFVFSIWNLAAATRLRKAIRDFEPDVIHLHNWHYGCGPIAIRVAARCGVPILLTLHNYRLLCPSGTLFHDGKLFLTSVGSSFPWNAVWRKVYRNSWPSTFWLAFTVWWHTKIGTWAMVSKFIVLTESAKIRFVGGSLGLPLEAFVTKPNFVAEKGSMECDRGDHFLFVGRLSEEKGVRMMLQTFAINPDLQLRIVGDGPLRQLVVEADASRENVVYLGSLGKKGVQEQLERCTALIFPSIWYEPFGLVLIEALALGCAVIASDIGAGGEFITEGENGLKFDAGDGADLARKLHSWIALGSEEKERFYAGARACHRRYFTSEINVEKFRDILAPYHPARRT